MASTPPRLRKALRTIEPAETALQESRNSRYTTPLAPLVLSQALDQPFFEPTLQAEATRQPVPQPVWLPQFLYFVLLPLIMVGATVALIVGTALLTTPATSGHHSTRLPLALSLILGGVAILLLGWLSVARRSP